MGAPDLSHRPEDVQWWSSKGGARSQCQPPLAGKLPRRVPVHPSISLRTNGGAQLLRRTVGPGYAKVSIFRAYATYIGPVMLVTRRYRQRDFSSFQRRPESRAPFTLRFPSGRTAGPSYPKVSIFRAYATYIGPVMLVTRRYRQRDFSSFQRRPESRAPFTLRFPSGRTAGPSYAKVSIFRAYATYIGPVMIVTRRYRQREFSSFQRKPESRAPVRPSISLRTNGRAPGYKNDRLGPVMQVTRRYRQRDF